MPTTADVGFVEMRIAKVVGLGPPLAERPFQCVVLDEVSGSRQVVFEVGDAEAFWLAARLQDLEFGRPMIYDFAVALAQAFGGRVRAVRIDRVVRGTYAATVEVEGPLGAQPVDARARDALNLAAVTSAPVLVSPEVIEASGRRQQDDSPEAELLRVALTVPQMTITQERPPEPADRP